MNTPQIAEVFLDTSVLFAAILSPDGGARMIFLLGESGYLRLLVGPTVLKEAEEVERRKAPDTLPDLALLLDAARVHPSEMADPARLAQAKSLLAYAPDAQVLAETLQAKPDWFITHDRRHFSALEDADLPFRIGAPSDLLDWLRRNPRWQARPSSRRGYNPSGGLPALKTELLYHTIATIWQSCKRDVSPSFGQV